MQELHQPWVQFLYQHCQSHYCLLLENSLLLRIPENDMLYTVLCILSDWPISFSDFTLL